ncbi:MAG: PAS domain-containing protein [Oceanibaculum nanhaiense]|uniref:PAS domain-containing protein n=1 Tax=Oceanibaculum nanhaiense TaxID=1909734 RepID=UPI0025A418D9|nr:PAS domain-containing protein [Oceanibaculum nanhaiense]MDM7947395.1 PAS domain-containing protein [Oceanibaculum nanhaiense]
MTVFDTSRAETTYSLGRVALPDIPDERLRKLALYWYSRRNGQPLPSRDDVDPLDLPSGVLPNMILLDIVGSERYRRFRFRLVGTAIYTHVSRELTGLHIDEALPEPYLSYVTFTHTTAADQRLPVYSETLYHDQGNFVNGITYRLVLPLASDGEVADMIMVAQFWIRGGEKSRWEGNWRTVQPLTQLVDFG